jgi:hypothetical protein
MLVSFLPPFLDWDRSALCWVTTVLFMCEPEPKSMDVWDRLCRYSVWSYAWELVLSIAAA